MDYEKKQKLQERQQNSEWFIISITGTIVTIITASILIIQFSQKYKDKAPFQYIIFLFAGILMLCLGIYLNYIIIKFVKNKKQQYGESIIVPQLLLKINIVFLIYAFYTGAKRISSFFTKTN
tara:strand:+ start:3420 stop:3785 length:366 start_codon:yes stop_codon:yes gene_type:complete